MRLNDLLRHQNRPQMWENFASPGQYMQAPSIDVAPVENIRNWYPFYSPQSSHIVPERHHDCHSFDILKRQPALEVFDNQ